MKNIKLLIIFLISVSIGVIGVSDLNPVPAGFEDNKKTGCQDEAKGNAARHDFLRAIVFRVYDPNGAPVDKAEILISTRTSGVKIPEDFARGRTVNGLWQTYVLCSANFPPHISQILYEYEVWSIAGKNYKGYWWQPTNSWVCNETKEITVRLKPVDTRNWDWVELTYKASKNGYILKDWSGGGTHLHPQHVEYEGKKLNGKYWVTAWIQTSSGEEKYKEKLEFRNGSTSTGNPGGGLKLGNQVVNSNQVKKVGVSVHTD